MASIAIRRLDDDVKTRLRVRAAANGRPMEEEARAILRESVAEEPEPKNPAAFIRECFAPYGGAELELPSRGRAEWRWRRGRRRISPRWAST